MGGGGEVGLFVLLMLSYNFNNGVVNMVGGYDFNVVNLG